MSMGASSNSELDRICDLVRACGRIIRDVDRTGLHVASKEGKANFVTEYDKLVQDRLQAGLREIVPDARFVGEEGSADRYSPKGKYFVVDPIDGTTNFIKDFHISSISVALIVDGAVELAVVHNPYTDEMFSARRGGGAFCNGKPIHVSAEPLERGIVVFGTAPYHVELAQPTFDLAFRYFRKALDIRRCGSAALDLCSVAAGRAELFFELTLAPWDHAAGGLIVQEAGGTISDFDGGPLAFDHDCAVLARGAGVSDADIERPECR